MRKVPNFEPIMSAITSKKLNLRNRKHRVIETQVKVWENEECCGNTSHRQVFPNFFEFSQTFMFFFNKLMPVFHASVLLLNMNFVVTLSK